MFRARRIRSAEAPVAPSVCPPAADPPARDPAIVRYLATIHELELDAAAHGRIERFADILAYSLATIAYARGGEAVGSVVEMVGRHVAASYAHERALAEAAREKEAGNAPQ